MARTYLRDLTDWKLSDSHQDIRGWTLRTSDGRPIGRIKHMVADTDTKHIESVMLEDGSEYAVENLQIGEGDVMLCGGDVNTGNRERTATTHTRKIGEDRAFRIPIIEEHIEVEPLRGERSRSLPSKHD